MQDVLDDDPVTTGRLQGLTERARHFVITWRLARLLSHRWAQNTGVFCPCPNCSIADALVPARNLHSREAGEDGLTSVSPPPKDEVPLVAPCVSVMRAFRRRQPLAKAARLHQPLALTARRCQPHSSVPRLLIHRVLRPPRCRRTQQFLAIPLRCRCSRHKTT